MSEQNGRFSLKEMQGKTPAVNPIEAMRRQMALGVTGAVREKDIAEMVEKLKAMAMGGNLKAMEMFFKLTLGDGKSAGEEQQPKGMMALADAVEDLVDEIRIAKAAPPKSRAALNGKVDDDDD